ncbi:MAG: hypothetical protein IVW57_18815, partial [Ktedonobacterales bacterium]|nr:hypothetical protein [Ktedonobacterales bacterium]
MSSAHAPAASEQGQACEEGVALFRRAIVDRDEQAWALLYRQYAPQVRTWVRLSLSERPQLAHGEGVAVLVNAAFAKFSQALTPAKMEGFDALSALLKYLKMCVHSVVADEARAAQHRQNEEPFWGKGSEPATQDDVSSLLVTRLVHQGLWRVVEEELHGEDERVQVRLGFIHGLKPREIGALYPQLFPRGAQDVARTRRNVLSRLRRSHRLRHYLVQHGYLTQRTGLEQDEEAGSPECGAPGGGTPADRRPRSAGEYPSADSSLSERRGGMLQKRLDLSAVCIAHLREYLELFATQQIIILAEDEPPAAGVPPAGTRTFSATVNSRPYQLTYRVEVGGTDEVI